MSVMGAGNTGATSEPSDPFVSLFCCGVPCFGTILIEIQPGIKPQSRYGSPFAVALCRRHQRYGRNCEIEIVAR